MMGGMAGAGITFREMRLQRHLHDRLVGVPLKLSEESDWHHAPFSVYEEGTHILYLATTNTLGKKSVVDSTRTMVRYQGGFYIALSDSHNRTLYSNHFDGNTMSLTVPVTTSWITLDSIRLRVNDGEQLRLGVSNNFPDTAFSHTFSEIVLMPPNADEITGYLRGMSYALVGMGAITFIGFCVTLYGGRMRRILRTPQ